VRPGGRLSPVHALRRSCMSRLFVPLWLLDSLWPLWETTRRAVHDLVAGTMVIARPDEYV
jgi:uncharacterized RDD family membrane protein YckC